MAFSIVLYLVCIIAEILTAISDPGVIPAHVLKVIQSI
jgi:hypothetical protein